MKRFIFVLLLALLPIASHAERGIIAAQSYDSPLGCAPDSVFNLVAGSTLNTFGDPNIVPGTNHQFRLITEYNNGQGASFQIMPTTIGSNLFVATSGLQPLSFFGSLQYSTANNPDVANTIGSIAVPQSEKIFIHGTRVVAPCGATNCLHNWLFSTTGAGPGVDTDFTIGSANATQGSLGGVNTGSSLLFLHRLITPVNTSMLWEFDLAGTTTLNFTNVGNINTTEMIQDTDHVYFIDLVTNSVKKVSKVGMVITTIPITPVTLIAQIDRSDVENSFYLATVSGGPVLTIRRYDSTLTTNTANAILGNESLSPFGIMVDDRAQKLYVVTEVPGFKRVRRINLSTMAIEQTLSIATSTTGFVAASDFNHRYIWISDIGNPSHIQRVQLCT